jgi:hypothetical protein
MKVIVRGAIVASLIGAPTAAWSQSGALATEGAAPVQKTEAANEDDHSYLPPSMRGAHVGAEAAPVAAGPPKANRTAHRRVRRAPRYADASVGDFLAIDVESFPLRRVPSLRYEMKGAKPLQMKSALR